VPIKRDYIRILVGRAVLCPPKRAAPTEWSPYPNKYSARSRHADQAA
jgi:hypothetical protein